MAFCTLGACLALAGWGEGNAPAPARSEPPAAPAGAGAGFQSRTRGSAPVRTVDHYLAHPGEREAVWAACRNNPGEARTDPNCHNALDARRRAGLRELQENAR